MARAAAPPTVSLSLSLPLSGPAEEEVAPAGPGSGPQCPPRASPDGRETERRSRGMGGRTTYDEEAVHRARGSGHLARCQQARAGIGRWGPSAVANDISSARPPTPRSS